MTQKKKTDFKIVTPPDDLSEVRAKTKKIHREKLKKIVVPVILIALAVSGTYLMLTNKAYSEAGTAVRYSTDSSDTSNYAHFANGIVRYNRDGVVFLNKKNEEKWIQSTQLKNPIIEVKEKAFAVGDIGGNVVATGHRRVHSLDRDSRSSRCQQVHGRAGDGLVRAERDRGNGEQQRIQQARRSAGEDDRQDHDRCADGDRQEFHDKCAAECADDHDALKADVDDAGTLREAAAQGDEKQDRGKNDRILDQQCHFCAPPFCSSASLARAARRSSPFRSEACRRSFRKPLNAHRKMMRLEIRLEICGE